MRSSIVSVSLAGFCLVAQPKPVVGGNFCYEWTYFDFGVAENVIFRTSKIYDVSYQCAKPEPDKQLQQQQLQLSNIERAEHFVDF